MPSSRDAIFIYSDSLYPNNSVTEYLLDVMVAILEPISGRLLDPRATIFACHGSSNDQFGEW